MRKTTAMVYAAVHRAGKERDLESWVERQQKAANAKSAAPPRPIAETTGNAKPEARAGGRKKSPIRPIIKELLAKDPDLTAGKLARKIRQRIGWQPAESTIRAQLKKLRDDGEI